MLSRIRALAFLVLVSALPLASVFAQTYPSQPTFAKCGIGIGPNSAELVALNGGPTDLNTCWIGNTAASVGGYFGYVVRTTNADPAAKLYFSGIGTWGTGVTFEKTEFFINAPYGNVLDVFTNEGGMAGEVRLGVGSGVADTINLPTRVRITENSANRILGSALLQFHDENAAANEQLAEWQWKLGALNLVSLTDAEGVGSTLFTADRSGATWQNVALTAGLGSLTLTGQSQATLTANVSTTVSAGTGDVLVTAPGTSSVVRLSAAGTLRLGMTNNTAGNRILFDDNTGESIDYDIRGALGNTAGDLQVFTRTDFATGIRNADGSAATPSYSFQNDTNTGLYSSSADHVGVTAGGTLAVDLSAAGVQVNGSCNTAGAPCYAFVNDPDTGLYRSANNTVGLVAGGTEAVNCTATLCTFAGAVTVTGTFTASGAGSTYACTVDSAATAEVCSTGWSVASNGSGDYTVTHNLGLANANNMAITVTPFATVSNACRVDNSNIGVNSFHYTCYTTSSGGAADSGVMLTAVRIQ